ncbi:MAG: alpha-glucan family phosphorylase [Verrucomicrobia bacterium]|nr:MAG: alpha-glucan family phosphorylase [Verrucomicrobiota bacterium]
MNSLKDSMTDTDELVTGLHRLAHNLWWTWSQDAQDIFHDLSPRCWQNLYHNAVAILQEVSDYELRMRLLNPDLAQRVREVLARFEAYMGETNTWTAKNAPQLLQHPVAYFSAEFGFHETLPIAAGGLGVLAGDHTKSASDLGLGFHGVSLFYREGYFQQQINPDNWQTEYYTQLNPKNLPTEPVLDANGEMLVCSVEIAMSLVYFQAWKVSVGRVQVYLLDCNRPENEQRFRDLTLRVYGGDSTTRIMQEVLLGIGGTRFLRALGVQPSVFHMNEGHAAFLVLELIREKLALGQSFSQASVASKAECIFTTHTPVEAGHDRFTPDLIGYALCKIQAQLRLSFEELMALGRVKPDNTSEPFCMTVLALKSSRSANGVSELHGEVSRQMWQELFRSESTAEVPIGHITNGVHVAGWMKGPLRQFWRQRLTAKSPSVFTEGEGVRTRFGTLNPNWHWEAALDKPEFWSKLEDHNFISDEELWALRYQLRRELIEFTRRRLLLQGHRLTQGDFIAFDHLLNPDALTIGFARRFATYKRAPLVFQQFENIVRLTKDTQRPVQFIFAGKAHPRDDDGKRFIQHIIHLSKYSELKGSLVFIENYDVHVARQMVSGCDVWLNNPRRPLEASGTSGQKTSCHGCLNLSILDGWWREGYDGTNGFSIGTDTHPDNIEEQDQLDSANLYRVLTEEVVPSFYNRDANGIPREWIQRIRRAMSTLVAQFSTGRMVQDYVNRYYLPK